MAWSLHAIEQTQSREHRVDGVGWLKFDSTQVPTHRQVPTYLRGQQDVYLRGSPGQEGFWQPRVEVGAPQERDERRSVRRRKAANAQVQGGPQGVRVRVEINQ